MNRLEQIPAAEDCVLLATGRYIGEGFDNARLDTLFLAMPISWKGTLQQYVGRLHRLHADKKEVIVYDYTDDAVPMLAAMFGRRLKGYEAAGYSVRRRVAVIFGLKEPVKAVRASALSQLKLPPIFLDSFWR